VQFLGCQNQVKTQYGKLLTGIVARAADLCKPWNLIGDTVFWRWKVIILNSKNTKPKQSKQHSQNILQYFVHWRCKHVNDLVFFSKDADDLKAHGNYSSFQRTSYQRYCALSVLAVLISWDFQTYTVSRHWTGIARPACVIAAVFTAWCYASAMGAGHFPYRSNRASGQVPYR